MITANSNQKLNSYNKFGGILIFISSFLLLVKDIAEFIIGSPPTNGTSILNWINTNKIFFIIINETFFIAVFLFIPSFIIIYYKLEQFDKILSIIGVTIMLLVVPIIAILNIVQGRLIYPVFNITVSSPDLVEYIIAIYYGGLHACYLMMGISVLLLTVVSKKAKLYKSIFYVGILNASALIVIMAYEWLYPTIIIFFAQLLFIIWFLIIGINIYNSK